MHAIGMRIARHDQNLLPRFRKCPALRLGYLGRDLRFHMQAEGPGLFEWVAILEEVPTPTMTFPLS
jgi:hypothetical protein